MKGYALLEYGSSDEAKKTIQAFNGKELADKKIQVDWAFKKPVSKNSR